MIDYYQVAKDFAGPAATVIASVTAAVITYRFGSKQTAIAQSQADTASAATAIARSQRDIAYDKLKHDLFDKRYEIYTTARELIENISGHVFENIHDPKIRKMRLRLDEAKFFFRPEATAVFSTIDQCVAEYLVGEVGRGLAGDDDTARFEASKKMTNALKVIVDIYAKFPDLMKDELGFTQLRGTASASRA